MEVERHRARQRCGRGRSLTRTPGIVRGIVVGGWSLTRRLTQPGSPFLGAWGYGRPVPSRVPRETHGRPVPSRVPRETSGARGPNYAAVACVSWAGQSPAPTTTTTPSCSWAGQRSAQQRWGPHAGGLGPKKIAHNNDAAIQARWRRLGGSKTRPYNDNDALHAVGQVKDPPLPRCRGHTGRWASAGRVKDPRLQQR